jgi:Skp family chaperone for outer membrane proteins
MTKLFMKAALASSALVALLSQPALGQTRPAARAAAAPAAPAGVAVPPQGIAVADLESVVGNADAMRLAEQRRQIDYKPQIDAYTARLQRLETELKPLIDKYNADATAAAPNQAALKTQGENINKLKQAGEREAAEIIKPYVYSQEYVKEQVLAKLDQAVKNAAAKARVTMILAPGAVVWAPTHRLDRQILMELNLLIPNAQVIPPAGWEPAELRQARAQQAAAQQQQAAQQGTAQPAAARPAQPAGPQPDGR